MHIHNKYFIIAQTKYLVENEIKERGMSFHIIDILLIRWTGNIKHSSPSLISHLGNLK